MEKWHSLAWIQANFLGKEVTDTRSPAANWLRFVLEEIEVGKAVIRVRIRPEMTNPYGNIHGGMMSLVIDETMGWAVASLGTESHFTSLNLSVDFLYAIKSGDEMRTEATVLRGGKRITNVTCYVYNMDGTLLSHANSNLITTGMPFATKDA